MITYRKANENDVPELLQLLSYTWAITYSYIISEEILHKVASKWHHEDELRNQIIKHKVHFIIAEEEENDKIIGLATFVEKTDELLILARLYINPGFQKQGIGQRLLESSLDVFKTFKHVQIKVEEKNIIGINFFLKNDFHIVSKSTEVIENNEIPIKIMQREL